MTRARFDSRRLIFLGAYAVLLVVPASRTTGWLGLGLTGSLVALTLTLAFVLPFGGRTVPNVLNVESVYDNSLRRPPSKPSVALQI